MTSILSMFISNTATTAMMVPIAVSLIDKQFPRMRTMLILGTAYVANIGGNGTVVGSPPNAIAAAALDISFYENNMQIAKNNSSILNNGFLPSITINGDANTNSQDIEIETPSGLSGTLKDSNTDNLSSNFSIIYNLIDGTGRKFNFQKSK